MSAAAVVEAAAPPTQLPTDNAPPSPASAKKQPTETPASSSSRSSGGGSSTAAEQLQRLLPAAAAVVKRLRFAGLPEGRRQQLLASLQRFLQRLRSWVWYLVEELLEEFQPWLKWIVFDALLTLVVGRLVRHAAFTRPLFEAVGWA